MATIKLTYDPTIDAAYIRLVDHEERAQSTRHCVCHDQNGVYLNGVVLDVDDFGALLGIEVLDASRVLPASLLAQAESPI